MQRPKLQQIVEHRPRRRRANRRGAPAYPRRTPELAAIVREPPPAPQPTRIDLSVPDIAAKRVREAGGPLDHASYTCQCGYYFEADVSTTVECPHCSTPQAW